MKPRTIAIIQARMGSARFPGKSLASIGSWTLIELVMKRVAKSTTVDQVILATSDHPRDDVLAQHVIDLGFQVARGSEDDVLSRFYQAAKKVEPEIVVRITGDCPLISPTLIDHAVESFIDKKVDYLKITIGEEEELAYPRGLDVEVTTYEALTKATENATETYDREHVMPYLYTHPDQFSVSYVNPPQEDSRPRFRLCVDTQLDFDLIIKLQNHFEDRLIDVDFKEIIHFLDLNPDIVAINQSVKQKHMKEAN